MSLTGCQSTPAINAAFYRPDGTLYILASSFHTYPDGTGAESQLRAPRLRILGLGARLERRPVSGARHRDLARVARCRATHEQRDARGDRSHGVRVVYHHDGFHKFHYNII